MWKTDIGMAGHRVPMFHDNVMYMLCVVRMRAGKQALEPGPAIDFMSLARSPSRHLDLGWAVSNSVTGGLANPCCR